MSRAAVPSPAEIRTLRTQLGLTQTQAAALIHCACRSWQDWEAGKRRMEAGKWELFRIKAIPPI